MSTWDINDIFIENVAITEPQLSRRRAPREVVGCWKAAILVGMLAATASTGAVAITPFDHISEQIAVVHRAAQPPAKRASTKHSDEGVDFARARPSERLATSFKTYFRPSS